MKPFRIVALAAVPSALLIGTTASAPAAAPAAKASVSRSADCHAPGVKEVVTAEQTIRLVKQCRGAKADPTWHWMGNYGSVYDVVRVANNLGVPAGGLVTNNVNPTGAGLFPTFMYY